MDKQSNKTFSLLRMFFLVMFANLILLVLYWIKQALEKLAEALR